MYKNNVIFLLLTSFSISQDNLNDSVTEQNKISFNLPSGVNIDVAGEVEFEFVDVEGAGGAINSTEFIQKVETRSPHVRIDKAVLKFKILYSDNISFRFGLRFNDDNAYVDKSYLLIEKNNTKYEIGSNRPAIALKRGIEGYPLIGTAFWKGRQYHVDIEKKYPNMNFGASLALKRPLGYDSPAEDKSYRILVYDNMPNKTRDWDGVTIESGLRASFNLNPIKITGWYYIGKLYDDYDWQGVLMNDFTDYRIAQGTVLPKNANRDHYWFGGRAELKTALGLFRGEYIYSLDGYLPRSGYYVEFGTPFKLMDLPLYCLFRYGELNINPESNMYVDQNWTAELDDPQTWDRSLITLAAVYELTTYSKIKFEYYITGETTGDTQELADSYNNNAGRDFQPDMNDNQLLIQFELNF
ncbi:hypothetical protein N9N24_02490 [Candidatus Marinimicrobia bacterium]|nr:hypothetical protein [Candidatus Neomarinimicrobiota bacterium]